MKLENGRPKNTEGRLEKEVRVYDLFYPISYTGQVFL